MVGSLGNGPRPRLWEAKVFSQWGLVNYTLGGAESATAYLSLQDIAQGPYQGGLTEQGFGWWWRELSTSPGGRPSGKGL